MPQIITRTREQAFELWIAALLSGKYLQASDALMDTVYEGAEEVGTGFCCVGVLCDLANKDRGEDWEIQSFRCLRPGYDPLDGGAFEYETSEMPATMRQFMGITEKEAAKLYKMNDKDSKTFAQIAVHIRDKVMPKALVRPMPFQG